ncbi:MAG: CDP-alcohol phosphatidyltransferase family protein [Gemmatimonadales bacterium]
MAHAAGTVPRERWFVAADLLTVIRVPLAIAFLLSDSTGERLAILWLAGISDFVDGTVARTWGSSRLGAFLDPVADKVFAILAMSAVLASGALTWWEVLAVLARDVAATIAFLLTVAFRRPAAIAARAAGKLVTIGQLLVLLAFLLDSWLFRPLAWATGALALYAIADYMRVARRQARTL